MGEPLVRPLPSVCLFPVTAHQRIRCKFQAHRGGIGLAEVRQPPKAASPGWPPWAQYGPDAGGHLAYQPYSPVSVAGWSTRSNTRLPRLSCSRRTCGEDNHIRGEQKKQKKGGRRAQVFTEEFAMQDAIQAFKLKDSIVGASRCADFVSEVVAPVQNLASGSRKR